MRISDGTRFPHPVLQETSDDFRSGEFHVHFEFTEIPDTGQLQASYKVDLTQTEILDLITRQMARLGCIIRCEDTYHVELRPLSWPSGELDFRPGSLLGRVTLRPIIWLASGLDEWDPGSIHEEFDPPVTLERGDIVGFGPEYVISVGQAKLQNMETIFELRRAEEMQEGSIEVELGGDRIGIRVDSRTYDTICVLRGQLHGGPILLNSVYLPAVMEVLDILGTEEGDFENRRWYRAFTARCDARGIDISSLESILESAQALLESPIRKLAVIVAGEDA